MQSLHPLQFLKKGEVIAAIRMGLVGVNGYLELRSPFSSSFSGFSYRRLAIPCFPRGQIRSIRMGKTLAHLGPRPVVDLHCAWLKVAERVLRENVRGLSEAALLEKVGAMGQSVFGLRSQ